MGTNYYLESENLSLKPYSEIDIKYLYQWFNDQIITYFLETGLKPLTEKQIKEELAKEIDSGSIIFILLDKRKKIPIGIIGLYSVNTISRKAEMRIIIGDKKYWGKGLGTQAVDLITFFAFDHLNLNKVALGVSAGNISAYKTYQKSGYKKEGILKDDVYRNGKFYDGINMAILRKDYEKIFYKKHLKRFTFSNNK